MFTILVKEKKSGREELLCDVAHVTLDPKGDDSTMPGLHIRYSDNAGLHYPISQDVGGFRDIFVMNEAGATVARYAL